MTSWRVAAALLLAAALSAGPSAAAAECPSDAMPRAAGVLLVVQGSAAPPLALDAAGLAALPQSGLTQRLTLSAEGGTASERSISYSGVRLRDLLLQAGFGGPSDRAARFGVVEAVATDGYRALFSWGELFNTAAGEQTLVISSQDGRPLDAAAGPLALRALADLRPGPRHVRNLCALLLRR